MLLIMSSICPGQEHTDELTAKYTATYAALLDSQSAATETVELARLYADQTPFKYEKVLSSVQKVFANRLTPKARKAINIPSLIVPCGDAAAAVDGGDFAFSECVEIIDQLSLSTGTSTYVSLTRLDALGIPVFRFIAVGIGRPVETVKNLSLQGRLKANVLAQLLLESFKSSYAGLAEKTKKGD